MIVKACWPSTTNIAAMDNNPPNKHVYLLKYLKLGLKFGAADTSNKKQARFVTMNVIKKDIVTKLAMLLTSENKHSWVSPYAISNETFFLLCNLIFLNPGKISSLEIASRT